MSRQASGKENIRKVQRSKGTYYITIPIGLMREISWQERQKVIVSRFGKGIRIKDWPLKRK